MIPPQRVSVRDLFNDTISALNIESIDETLLSNLSRRMERACYNLAIEESTAAGVDRYFSNPKFLARYSAINYKIISNISIDLLNKILSGVIDENNIALMSSAELNSSYGAEIRAKIKARNELKVANKVCTAYTCHKCGEKRTTTHQYQGRCADEGESVSIQCVNCSHTWKKI